MGRLENKVAIVTGGAKGIGYVTCNTFSREGASVVIVDMDKEAAEKAAQEINDKGGKALAEAVYANFYRFISVHMVVWRSDKLLKTGLVN